MSGYIGTTPRKMIRGWIDIPNKENIEDFVETKDINFQGGEFTVADVSHGFYEGMKYYELINGQYIVTNDTTPRPSKIYYYTEPIKEYYELVDNEYVLTDDFYQDSTTGNWVKNWDSTKTYYERNIHYGSSNIRKIIRKAWIGNANSEPELALYGEQYYIENRLPDELPIDFKTGLSVVYNNKIHIFDGYNEGAHPYYNHYSWDGNNWTNEGDITISGGGSNIVVYQNKIHILGGDAYNFNKHYSWDGENWTNEENLPYSLESMDAKNRVVVYNNKIYLFYYIDNRTRWYTYDGTSWTLHNAEISSHDCRGSSVVVFNDKIHIFGGDDSISSKSYATVDENDNITLHQNYDSFGGNHAGAVVYRNKVHILGGLIPNNSQEFIPSLNHVIFSGSVNSTQIPHTAHNSTSVVVYNDEIHLLGGNTTTDDHLRDHYIYKLSDSPSNYQSPWYFISSIPFPFIDGYPATIFNDKINIFGPHRFFIYDNKKWIPNDKSDGMLNCGLQLCTALVYNGELYLLGDIDYQMGSSYYPYKAYLKYSESNNSFTRKELPYAFIGGAAVVYDNKIHIFGSTQSSFIEDTYISCDQGHYSWDGNNRNTWVNEGSLGNYGFNRGAAVVYHNKIYLIGGNVNYRFTEIYYNNGTRVINNINTLPMMLMINCAAVVYHDKIHVFGGNDTDGYNKHYSWDGENWTREFDLPYNFYLGKAVVIDDEICLLGGNDNPYMMFVTNYNAYFK